MKFNAVYNIDIPSSAYPCKKLQQLIWTSVELTLVKFKGINTRCYLKTHSCILSLMN